MKLPVRSAFALLAAATFAACSEVPTQPAVRFSGSGTTPSTPVISQVYGGGGNSGATYKNDFIEIFNPNTTAVNLSGYSVQYASATGTTWQVTSLSGTLNPGHYYLVQESQGTGGTTSLPTPDAAGTIAMSATAGKVVLVSSTTASAGACPSAGIVDEVSFGTTASDCGSGTTATLTNTTAAIRGNGGCAYTGSLSADFAAAAPTPRNSSSATQTCGGSTPQPATVTVTPNPGAVFTGSTTPFAASAVDAGGNPVSTTFTWTITPTTVATIDAGTGVASGVAPGTATVTATAANGVAGTATLSVSTAPPPSAVLISQIYGGGGNSGAPYTNDFVELFNDGATVASVGGWNIQYSSATGSFGATNLVTLPAGATIQPFGYYLVQLAAGAASPAPLPTPDATGGINMSGTSGKVILTTGVTATTACPTGAGIVDHLDYGTSTNCSATWGGNTANLSNITAAFRSNDGCVNSGSVAADFVILAPNPRNSASAHKNCTQPNRPQSTATIAINELMSDPANAESASWGQWFEVYNYGTQPVDLNGWTIVSGGTSQPDAVINSSVVVPAGGFAVLGRGADTTRNGGVVLNYNYFVGSNNTIWLDPSDFLMLVDNVGARVDSVAWTSMAHGVTKGLRDASQPHANVDGANWGYSTTTFGAGDYGTPGAANGTLASSAPFVSANVITISGRVPTDAPLPVGFEAQLFATEADQSGNAVTASFIWTAMTPTLASIDQNGVIHAIAAGNARFQATSSDGATRTTTLVMATGVASTTAVYGNNTEFGDPTDADPSDDYLVRRREYTTSWNGHRGIPNWVAYDLNGTQITPGQDRCNCFTFDPVLQAAGFTRYTTADYTGAGASAGYGIDRGHMTRSFDRTSGTLDNANTFLFSNVVPQASDLNQGPWAILEDTIGALAQNANKEVYIYVGPAGSLGTVKGEGKITIPAYTWKIALVLPRGAGLSSVHDYRDVQDVIAVVMPNQPGIRNINWITYKVSIDSIEHLTGYHFLSALPADVQRALKSGTQPPIAKTDGPYVGAEGTAIAMSGAASADPNGTITGYAWDFGDGATGTGATVTHTYTRYGAYPVRLVVTDNDGLVDTTLTTATVANVAPVVSAFSGARIVAGQTYGTTGSFTDPGADPFSATVDYGDGAGQVPLTLSGTGFTLSHTYASYGTFTVTVRVSDGQDVGTGTQTVTVLSPPIARTNGPFSSTEGASIAMSAASSSDPDGSIATYQWDFGDGNTGTGVNASHVYAQDGSYVVHLTVTDNDALTSSVTTSASVSNVAPSIAALAGASLITGETYGTTGSFADPGADTWSATIDYGDGSGTQPLALSGKTFSLSHTYTSAGTFTVTVRVSDGAVVSSAGASVSVVTPAQAVQAIIAQVTDNSLASKLSAAASQLASGKTTPAANQLGAFLNELDAMAQSGRMSQAQADALRSQVNRILADINSMA